MAGSPARPHVILASMPWTTLTEPSLGLAILKAKLRDHGISARVAHLNLGLLRFLQAKTYYALANMFALNDFLFSATIEHDISPHQHRLLTGATANLLDFGIIDADDWGGLDGVIEQLITLRQETIPAWLDEEADRIAAERPSLLGFTCMFDQTIASVALARLVRLRAPGTMIALGGYAVRAPTAQTVMHAFPWIDAICMGEGEPAILGLAEASVGQIPLESVPNLLMRGADGELHETEAAPLIDLDRSPAPDYDDFFDDLRTLEADHAVAIDIERLPLENSRGCWWGQKSHCVFCGIADSDMVYRARSPDSVIAALDRTARRHDIHAFRFSDYILPQAYYRTLLPRLAAHPVRYTLTGEIKANVKPEWMAALAAAGFTEVQPGIESLSDKVLATMHKGVAAVQNVHTLLLGKGAGVLVHHNLIYGFPDDEAGDYRRMLASLPRLFHLDPPSTRLPVQITRFAPLQEQPERFGLEEAHPAADYQMIFSAAFLARSGFDLASYCYYFERPFENSPELQRLYRRIDAMVDRWKDLQRQREVILSWRQDGDGIAIVDTRGTEPRHYRLGGLAAAMLEAMREPIPRDRLLARFAGHGEDGRQALERLDQLGLFFEAGDRLVALPLPEETRWQHEVPLPAWTARKADPIAETDFA
ncbi:MAG: RiPP maturation radical SAM C-methyltransferase [Sphingomonas sp.]